MRDEQANQIIQHLSKIEQFLQEIAEALNRMSPEQKGRDETVVFLPRVGPEPPEPPPGAPPIIKSRLVVTPS
jgi:hypothetical protein